MIRGITFEEQLTTSKDFSHFQNIFLDKSCGITKGCQVSYNTEKVFVTTGYFVVAGRFVQIVGTQEIDTPTVEVGEAFCQAVFEVDLSQFNTVDQFSQGCFKVVASSTAYPDLVQQDLDADGTLYQMPFAKFKKTVSGITDFMDTSVIIHVSEIWGRVARQNQQYRDDFETFYNNQKQEIVTKTGNFETYKQQYEQNILSDYNLYTAYVDAQKALASKYFDDSSSDFDDFFVVQKKKIEDMIAALDQGNFLTNEQYNVEKEKIITLINGFAGNTTTFNSDGSVTEIDSDRNTKVTTFPEDSLALEIMTKVDGTVIKKRTYWNEAGQIQEEIVI